MVLAVITPTLDRRLTQALGALRRVGMECLVVWICPGDGPPPKAPALRGVRVIPIRGQRDLLRLGLGGL